MNVREELGEEVQAGARRMGLPAPTVRPDWHSQSTLFTFTGRASIRTVRVADVALLASPSIEVLAARVLAGVQESFKQGHLAQP